MQFGNHIATLRLQKQLTQAQLASACDKDMQSISRLERGKINPSIYFLFQISNALGISVKDLLDF